jgi:ribonucleoside-diphosphate reductase alpha chain
MCSSESPFEQEISSHVWRTKYQHREGEIVYDHAIEDTWRRVARVFAAIEPKNQGRWEQRFFQILEDFRFLPGGRIHAGAGTSRKVTLFNCFVMGQIQDSMESIFENLKEGAITMQQGGGVGYDFSSLRPRGTRAKGVGAIASGPVSFMEIWDTTCATLLSSGARRGAMMATLRCDHPDIEEFIQAKQAPGKLRNFNLSVQVTDDFLKAVREDEEWTLVFPTEGLESDRETSLKHWSGKQGPVPCRVFKRVSARKLWDSLMRAAYEYAEPGVIFIDRINRMNNLWYCEHISATNPCGEIPLPAYGACNLGSINLTQFVRDPFTGKARLNMEGICETVKIAVRLLDNVVDASQFPLDEQQRQARGSRRIGLGLTGLADSLIMLGARYGSQEGLDFGSEIMRNICYTAYRTSAELAKEKGSFPFFDKEEYLQGEFVCSLPDAIKEEIARHGIRNSHLLAIAPAGTISLLANNVSSGIEPVFGAIYKRKVLGEKGKSLRFEITDYACHLWKKLSGITGQLPPAFVDAHSLPPKIQLEVQAEMQRYVDNSISKTINVAEDYPFDAFRDIYTLAYEKGLKGCTVFRPNPITGEVLVRAEMRDYLPHCCTLEREAD